jgi:hypothetical protein
LPNKASTAHEAFCLYPKINLWIIIIELLKTTWEQTDKWYDAQINFSRDYCSLKIIFRTYAQHLFGFIMRITHVTKRFCSTHLWTLWR